jgi:hypothetical protein
MPHARGKENSPNEIECHNIKARPAILWGWVRSIIVILLFCFFNLALASSMIGPMARNAMQEGKTTEHHFCWPAGCVKFVRTLELVGMSGETEWGGK